jgi:hypothetical protein
MISPSSPPVESRYSSPRSSEVQLRTGGIEIDAEDMVVLNLSASGASGADVAGAPSSASGAPALVCAAGASRPPINIVIIGVF